MNHLKSKIILVVILLFVVSASAEMNPLHGSPGIFVGDTWYELQQYGSMGRMIDWGPVVLDPEGDEYSNATRIHFTWNMLPGPSLDLPSKIFYRSFNAHDWADGYSFPFYDRNIFMEDNEYGLFSNLEITPDGRAIMICHIRPFDVNNPDIPTDYMTTIYIDDAPGYGLFGPIYRMPDDVLDPMLYENVEIMWPKISYQYGTDTVLHLIARDNSPTINDPAVIYYFRGIGDLADQTEWYWDFPPHIIDTIANFSHDIAADKFGNRVAIVWNANLPNPGDCDTCSGTSDFDINYDNDLYCQISRDQGTTWEPRINVTKNQNGVAGFRPYTDLSALMTDELHIIWSSVVWPENPDDGWATNSRLFHWSESASKITTIHTADRESTACQPEEWNLNIAKMSISQCDGKLYALWSQSDDDCHQRGGYGAVNNDLWISVSDNNGLSWDLARNITHSYSSGCNPSEGGVWCSDEKWPSMARFGHATKPEDNWPEGEDDNRVDPSGSYTGSIHDGKYYYLDVQYILDKDPGSTVLNNGSWQLNAVSWLRLACVEPDPSVNLTLSLANITKTIGSEYEQSMLLEIGNYGNLDLAYTVTTKIDNGPTGWLEVSGFTDGVVLHGINNLDSLTVTWDLNGITYAPDIILTGRLIFSSNAPSSPDTLEVTLDLRLDSDDDGIPDFFDNCPYNWNPDQIEPDLCNGCCINSRGNSNGDPADIADIDDLIYLVDFAFNGGSDVVCLEEGDVDASGVIDVDDLVFMVAFAFNGGPAPVDCP